MVSDGHLIEFKFRPLKIADVADAFKLWSDRDAAKFTNWTITPDFESCQARIEKVVEYYGKNPNHFGPFTIRGADDQFLGIIGADERDANSQSYEVWYFLERGQWGKGLATQAVRQLLGLMRTSNRVKHAIATAAVDNPASWTLLERLGFLRESREANGFQKHDLTCDLFKYRLEMAKLMKIQIECLKDLPFDFEELVAESQLHGHDFLMKMKAEWEADKNRFQQRNEILFGLRESNGALVGVGGVNVDPYANDPSVGRVRHVYIREAYRRQGLARLLMGKIMDHSKRSFRLLRLRTHNPEAGYLYESIGFSRIANADDSTHLYYEIEADNIGAGK